MVEAGREAVLSMHLYGNDSIAYVGSVNLTVTSNGVSNVMYFDATPHKISTRVSFDVVDVYMVNIVADNEVSVVTKNILITVVSK